MGMYCNMSGSFVPFKLEDGDEFPEISDFSILFDKKMPINFDNAAQMAEKFGHLMGDMSNGFKAHTYIVAGLHPLYWPVGSDYNIISKILLSPRSATEENEHQFATLAMSALDYLGEHLVDGDRFTMSHLRKILTRGPYWDRSLGGEENAEQTIIDIETAFEEMNSEDFPSIYEVAAQIGIEY